jgi:glycogen(starch) synthase
MKVLMTTDTVGGVWTHALDLCAALPEVQFVLAALGPLPSQSQCVAAARLRNVRLECRPCRLEWMPDCEAEVEAAGAWLLRLASRHAPDLVHVNGYAHASLDWQVPVLLGAHSCVVSWWRAVHEEDPPPRWNRYRERLAAAFARADALVAPTESFLRELAALHGAPRRSYAIYNSCGEREAPPGATRARLVLGAGRLWDPAKNIVALDQAGEGLDAAVVVAGETVAPHGGELGLPNARPLGQLSRSALRAWMERAAVFAAPALYEPFGLAPLEAALAGCALVLGDIPSQRELWQGAALFVRPRDPSALRAILQQLLNDGTWRDSVAARCRERARLYTPERMAVGYRAVYRELAPGATLDNHAEVAA